MLGSCVRITSSFVLVSSGCCLGQILAREEGSGAFVYIWGVCLKVGLYLFSLFPPDTFLLYIVVVALVWLI